VQLHADRAARDWFGDGDGAEVFQWHYESFELPAGATLLASSAACPRQAFSIGPHLAMQFHVELDAAKLNRWCDEANDDPRVQRARTLHTTLQAPAQMRLRAPQRLMAQQALAAHIYARWLSAATV
jgi:GMP synthase (glutamine-hydrolysing)